VLAGRLLGQVQSSPIASTILIKTLVNMSLWCPSCSKKQSTSNTFCSGCGVKLPVTNTTQSTTIDPNAPLTNNPASLEKNVRRGALDYASHMESNSTKPSHQIPVTVDESTTRAPTKNMNALEYAAHREEEERKERIKEQQKEESRKRKVEEDRIKNSKMAGTFSQDGNFRPSEVKQDLVEDEAKREEDRLAGRFGKSIFDKK